MSLLWGALIILGIALTLFLLFKKIFTKKRMSGDEVLNKEVHRFDHKTGDEKIEGKDESKTHREEADKNKKIK
jgi:phosphoribulokinase